MKKLAVCLFALLLSGSVIAQTGNMPVGVQLTPTSPAYDAPSIVISQFNAKYPDVAEAWKKDGDNFSAIYLDPKTNMGRIIVYDRNGNIIRNDKQVEPRSAPKAIGEFYKTTYPDEQYDLWFRENKSGNKLYYSVRNSDTLRFDKSGKNLPSSSVKQDDLK